MGRPDPPRRGRGDAPADGVRTRPWQGDREVSEVEALVLGQMFGIATARLLSEIRRDTRAIFPPVRDRLYRDLVRDGCFLASPRTVRRFWGTIGDLLR